MITNEAPGEEERASVPPPAGESFAVAIEGELPAAPWTLASTPWPRSGGCLKGSRSTAVVGPRGGTLRELFVLPGKPNPTRQRYARSGVATAGDGFRVTSRRKLFAFDGEGALRWQTPMLGPQSRYETTPLMLEGDVSVVGLDHLIAFVDAEGTVARVRLEGGGLDDTGHSPNLTRDGRLVLTGPLREVSVLDPAGGRSLGPHGLDIAPPAVTDDGALVVAGFGGDGLVLLDPATGAARARGADLEVDQMPTVGPDGRIAVGSSLGPGWILERDGATVASGSAQAFAALEHEWRALSYGSLRALDADGELRWETPMGDGFEVGWHLRLVVDREGTTYVPLHRSVVAVDAEGAVRFEVDTRERPTDIAPLADGRMVVVTAARVLLLE